jgi:alanyl-tRNA synthetase
MLNHSATHILHSVLRRELGSHVRQAGSLVAPDRLRFDFHHAGPIVDEKLAQIEARVNDHIREDAAVSIEEMNYQDAIRAGALAFFGDKYGDRVRVVKIGDISTELCGGTHVKRSGQIGLFKLPFEGGVAAGVRRVEAFTGAGALDLIGGYERRLKEIGALVRGSADDAVDKVKKLLERQKEMEKEIAKLRGQLEGDLVEQLGKEKKSVDGANVLISRVQGVDEKQLGELVDKLKQRLGSGFVFLANTTADTVTLVASTSSDLTKRFNANTIIKEVAPIVEGRGGGRPDFAKAGGKDPSKTDEAIKKIWDIISQPTIP